MPNKNLKFVDKAVDSAARQLKGPLDRMAELRTSQADLVKRIAAGESGDGLKKPDLKAQLRTLQGDLKNLEQANPGK